MLTKLSGVNDCCEAMSLLKEPERQCNIYLDTDDGTLSSCDDDGTRLPPINFCPWCGTDLEREVV